MALQSQKKLVPTSGPLLFVLLLVLSLIITVVYSREGETGPLHSMQNAVSGMVAPLKFMGAVGGAGGEGVGVAVENATASDDSLNGLRAQNEELRQRLSQVEEYSQEAKNLQDLLGIRDSYALNTVGARVIGKNTTSWSQVVTIDRGVNDGIRSGLPVMGQAGLIGQVISTTPSTAEVRLLQDSQSGVSVLVQSNRAEGIVRGSVEGVLYLEDMAAGTEVVEGDVIVTSGLGGGFFRGLIVGTVAKVEKKPGDSTSKIVVVPNSSTGPLQDVLVVLSVGSEGAAAPVAAPVSGTETPAADKTPDSTDGKTGENGA